MTSIGHLPAASAMSRWRVRALTTPILVFTAMTGLGLAFSVRLLTPWESWFLQIAARMRAGDVLYRDVAYGAGPVPAYLTEGMTYLFGVEVLAVKLVGVLAFAATAALTWLVAERLELGTSARLLVVGALLYFGPPVQQPPYAPIAGMFLVATLLAALVCRGAETRRVRLVGSLAAGGAAALAFTSKQNVGLLALAAFLLLEILGRRLVTAFAACGSFVAVTCCALLPVWLSGGFSRYVDYGFTGKGEYVNAPDPFVPALRGVISTLSHVRSPANAEAAFWALAFFLPLLAAVALVALAAAPRLWRSTATIPVVVFAAAAAATVYPRFDPIHVGYVAPTLVLLLALGVNAYRRRLPRPFFTAIAVWVGITLVIVATLPLRLARSPNAELSTLPHLHGAFVEPKQQSQWQREAAQLVSAAGADRDGLFLLVPDAGFRYLMTGLKNPTPFDFPYVTTFGRNGQQRVIAAIASGEIRRVCVADARDWSGFEPVRLVTYVQTTLRRGPRVGPCTLYSN